jgi:hypothetical protein
MSACNRKPRYRKVTLGGKIFYLKIFTVIPDAKIKRETLICIDFRQKRIVNSVHSFQCFPGCIPICVLRTAQILFTAYSHFNPNEETSVMAGIRMLVQYIDGPVSR